MKNHPTFRELTATEKIKYSKQIAESRKGADEYVFGYKKIEVYCSKSNNIITMARGEAGVGWVRVSSCNIPKNLQPNRK